MQTLDMDGHRRVYHFDDDREIEQTEPCPACFGSGWVRKANRRPYLSWAYREWDERCPEACDSLDARRLPLGEDEFRGPC